MDKELLTIDDASLTLSLGRSKVYQLVLSGELRSIKIGRSRRIPMEAIDEFIRSRMEQTADEAQFTR